MEKIKLGELCKPSAGQIKEDSDELIDYIDISSVDNETKRVTGYQTIAFGEAPSRARKAVKRGSVLVSTVRPNLNAVAMLEDDTPNITVASTGFCILDCKENVNNRFIFNFCKSKAFIDDMVSQATGASYPAVSDKIVRSALVPNYSYEEQCQISEVLDRVSAVIDNRKAELSALDDLIKARFVEMFGSPFDTNKWTVKELKDVSESMVDGSNVNPDYYEAKGAVLFLRIQNVWRNEFRLDDSVYITQEINQKYYYDTSLRTGDLLITKIGRYYTKDSSLGRVSVYRGENDCANYSNNIMRVRLSNSMNSEFVNALLNLDDYQSFIKRTSKGGTDKRALSKSLIGSYPIIIPPRALQDEFVAFVEQVDKSKVAVQKALDETQLLFDSLMQKYFG